MSPRRSQRRRRASPTAETRNPDRKAHRWITCSKVKPKVNHYFTHNVELVTKTAQTLELLVDQQHVLIVMQPNGKTSKTIASSVLF